MEITEETTTQTTLEGFLKTQGLSRRETEIGELVNKGLSNREIAKTLFVNEKTVKFHLTNIFRKIGTPSRAKFIVYCHQNVPPQTH